MSADPASHSKRESFRESHERLWCVMPQGLNIVDADARSLRIDYRDIESLRVAYAPTQLKLWRYVAEIRLKSGHSFVIDNGHFHGIGDFEERSDSFRQMLAALFSTLKQHNPDAVLVTGEHQTRHWGYSIMLCLSLLLLAWVAWAVSGNSLLIALIIFGAVFLTYASGAGDLMHRTRPGSPQKVAELTTLPEAHLPPLSDDA
ncbi:hypothetical protein [Asticcacaulis tiandongensis]|uniref:hypothetical protein n=1 Tax=Asticcacaulis tiandongensis TaxID=2565365 RepID=UPI00112C2434|nr:hypothetical protein [Asticcacaulis tiandongensis]